MGWVKIFKSFLYVMISQPRHTQPETKVSLKNNVNIILLRSWLTRYILLHPCMCEFPQILHFGIVELLFQVVEFVLKGS
jgi:hypothetical protein